MNNGNEMKQGLHQFTMHFFNHFSKMFDTVTAKTMVIKAFEDEIDYIISTEENIIKKEAPDSDKEITVRFIKKKIEEFNKQYKKATDENEKFDIAEKLDALEGTLDMLK